MHQDASQGSSCCWYYSPRLPRRHAASFSPAFSIATSEGLAVAIVGTSAKVRPCTDRAPAMSGNGAGHYGEGHGGDGNDSRHPCRSPWRAPALRSGVQIGSPADLSNPLWALILSHTPNKEGHYKWPSLFGAGDGNRTHASSLGSCSSTIELHPRFTFSAHLRDPFVAYRQAAFHGALPGPHIPVRSLAARVAMLRVKSRREPHASSLGSCSSPLNYTRVLPFQRTCATPL